MKHLFEFSDFGSQGGQSTKETLKGYTFNDFVTFDEVEVETHGDYVTKFLGDIASYDIYSRTEHDFDDYLVKPLEALGFKKSRDFDYEPWTTEEFDEFPGYLKIEKDSLNRAIDGGLKIKIDRKKENLVLEK